MTVLLDTHALLWWWKNPQQLSATAKRECREARSLQTPLLQFLVGERCKSSRLPRNQPLKPSGSPFLCPAGNRHQFGHRLLAAGDDHFLALLGLLDQTREVGLGLMDGVTH